MLKSNQFVNIVTCLLCGFLLPRASDAAEFRSIDGSGNNMDNSTWGQTDTQLFRMFDPAYQDGMSEPRGGGIDSPLTLPSTRDISNKVAAQSQSIKNSKNLSDWFWQWGQFIDHDMDLTEIHDPEEPFNILVPADDFLFDPDGTGMETIDLNRSTYDPTIGISNPRQQTNQITAYLDASMLYGSDQERADVLRSWSDGKFKASDGKLMMFNTMGEENANDGMLADEELFLSGDTRANEQLGLITAHTLFMREHNRLTDKIKSDLEAGEPEVVEKFETFESDYKTENPDATDEKVLDEFLYQTARKIVGAQIQVITYHEFLPLMLGPDALIDFDGYKSDVNASISNEFSTAAFRFGHTMLSPQLKCTGGEDVSLRDSFFRPDIIVDQGIDCFLSGLASQRAQEVDPFIIDDVRNFLFGPPGAGGFDLASLNMQRGREHGIPSYNDVRSTLELGTATTFADITSNVEIQTRLASAYDSVDDVDLWIGGLAEDDFNGGVVGQVFHFIIKDQFSRLRDGDRFFYLNENELEHLSVFVPDLTETKLSDIIKRNSDVAKIQDNVFIVSVPESSSVLAIIMVGIFGLGYFQRIK